MAVIKADKDKTLNLRRISWGGLVWIDIMSPTTREMQYLGEQYHFHHLDLDDCLSRIQRPKIDEYEDYLFLVFHFPMFNKQTRVSYRGQLSVFIGKDYLITVHTEQLKPLANLFNECLESEEARKQNLNRGSGYLLYHILDKGIDSYFPVLDKILSLIEDMEDSVFDTEIESGRELAVLRRDIITQRRIFWPMRSMMSNLGAKLQKYTKMDLTVYFGDLMDHINMICESIDECKEVIEVYKDSDFLLSNYRLSHTTRILAVISAIVLPFLIISSIYGMNIILPGGVEKGSGLYTFVIIISAMFSITAFMLWVFKRKHLI